MGCFSWIYSNTNKPMRCDKQKNSYLLVPEPFRLKYGNAIRTTCYDGYGHFGLYDIYDLVAEWNKEVIPDIVEKIRNGEWKCRVVREQDIENLERYYNGENITCELRWLGIIMACNDEDNIRLKYPIKITSTEMDYDKALPSKTDPMQGCS